MTGSFILALLLTFAGPAAAEPPPDTEVPARAPPFTPGVFPCTNCHAMLPVNPTPRTLGYHAEIQLDHGPREGWCFECHDADDRDRLHRASGAPVEFSASYNLCGQCHGPKLRDWRAGVHGKRTGQWRGEKEYLLCVHCHDPHAPRFAPMTPEPRPLRPGEEALPPQPEAPAPEEGGHD